MHSHRALFAYNFACICWLCRLCFVWLMWNCRIKNWRGTSNEVNHQLKIPMNSKESQKSTKEILKSKKKKKNLSTQKRTWYATNRMYVQFTKHKHETLNSCVELIYYTKNWPHCNEGMNRNAKIKKLTSGPACNMQFLSFFYPTSYGFHTRKSFAFCAVCNDDK